MHIIIIIVISIDIAMPFDAAARTTVQKASEKSSRETTRRELQLHVSVSLCV